MKIYKEDLKFFNKLKEAFDKKKVPFDLIMSAKSVNWENLLKDDSVMIDCEIPNNMVNIMNMSSVITQLCDKVAEGDISKIHSNMDKEIKELRISDSIFNNCLNSYMKFYNSIIWS